MRQELSLLTLPMINISLTNFCERQMNVHKTCCSFWELLCIKQQNIPGSTVSMWLKQSSLYALGIKASMPILIGPSHTRRLMLVKECCIPLIIHARIKAFSLVCHSAPHLVCKYNLVTKSPQNMEFHCTFKKLQQKSLNNLNKIFCFP